MRSWLCERPFRSSQMAPKPFACTRWSADINAFSKFPPHRTHNRFSFLTPAREAEHGSKLLLESTTAQTSPAVVSFASKVSDRLVLPELAPPAISITEPLAKLNPADSSTISSECFCSSWRWERLFTRLK